MIKWKKLKLQRLQAFFAGWEEYLDEYPGAFPD
jgi:hypothetical protein